MNNIKMLRGQMRQLVKELLPQVLASELVKAIEEKLLAELKEGISRLEEKQKDMHNYVIRQLAVPKDVKTTGKE